MDLALFWRSLKCCCCDGFNVALFVALLHGDCVASQHVPPVSQENCRNVFLWGPPAHIFRTRAMGTQTIDAFCSFEISENSSSSAVLLPLAPASLFSQLFDAFWRLLSILFTFRYVHSILLRRFCSQRPSGHADRSRSSPEKARSPTSPF